MEGQTWTGVGPTGKASSKSITVLYIRQRGRINRVTPLAIVSPYRSYQKIYFTAADTLVKFAALCYYCKMLQYGHTPSSAPHITVQLRGLA